MIMTSFKQAERNIIGLPLLPGIISEEQFLEIRDGKFRNVYLVFRIGKNFALNVIMQS